MIECRINGSKTHPSLSAGLKIVIENPAMREKSSYTYDILFPLDVPQNVEFFSHLGHLSVGVKHREYDDCRLILDNKVLFAGKGIVTAVNQSEVKMQIIQEVVTGIPEVFSGVYIDKVYYPPIDSRFKQAQFDNGGDTFDGDEHAMISFTSAYNDLNNNKFVGERFKYTFVTTVPGDASVDSAEHLMNAFCFQYRDNEAAYAMYNLAVQPNLMYVLKQILSSKGYSYDISCIDTEPWNDLYVCSSTRTLNIGEALPHWTIEKFLNEIGKLFNVSWNWDEENHSVSAVKIWENSASESVKLETVGEFEKNYDEDGQEYSDTSNLTYALSDTHDGLDTIEREALEHFGVKMYATETAMRNAVAQLNEKDKKTSFFSNSERPELYYWHESDEDGDTEGLQPVGLFRPLFRDLTADNKKDLNIIPVAIEDDEIPFFPVVRARYDGFYLMGSLPANIPRPVVYPTEYVEDYISVQDVIEGGDSIDDKEDETPIEIMFVNPLGVMNFNKEVSYQFIYLITNNEYNSIANTAGTNNYPYHYGLKPASLSLNECNSMKCIGEMHISQMQIDKATGFKKNEETILKFIRDSIPPINNIFLIRNKRYLAKQLEIQLTENGFSKEITGHFYELDS